MLAAAAFAAAAVFLAHRRGIETGLYELVGGDSGLIGALAEKTSASIRVLCLDGERAAQCRAIYPALEGGLADGVDEALDFFAEHRGVLLAEKTREMLAHGEDAKVRRSIARRDCFGIGLFPKKLDPCYFLSDYVTSLKALLPPKLDGGATLLSAPVAPGEPSCRSALEKLASLAARDDGIFIGGAPFHTLLATAKSTREINILATASLFVILAIGLALFRSARFILPTLLVLCAGFAAGAFAVFAIFPRPHVLTFLFGTSLVGLGVDYCYHALTPHSAESAKRLRGDLAKAFATTALAFVPPAFAPVAILNQMAAFTIAGLAMVFCAAFVLCRKTPPSGELRLEQDSSSRPPERPASLAAIAGALAICALASAGIFRLEETTEPSAFYTPPQLLARGEKRLAETLGAESGFIVSQGATLDEALENEERSGIRGISMILPSAKRQRENARLLAAFEGDAAAPASPVTLDALPRPLRTLADAAIFTLPARDSSGGRHSRVCILAPATGAPEEAGRNILRPKEALDALFARLSAETKRLAAVSLAIMALALIAIFRRRVIEYALPLAMAIAASCGVLGWLGEKLVFFHFLALFATAGIGIDYVIFHRRSASPASRRIVLASFLTSLAGFGALAFTSFAPTRALGLALALGLAFAYAFSLALAPRRDSAAGASSDWASQKEQSAGRLRILAIWWIYRLIGKNAAKAFFVLPFLFIYPFCREARAALRRFYGVLGSFTGSPPPPPGRMFMQMLAFAWSAIDKTDACTLCKNPPSFTFSGDTGWMDGKAFLVSTHVGCIEVLPALRVQLARAGKTALPRVHAFQQMGHDAVFTGIFAQRLSNDGFTLHAVEDIGVETAAAMHDEISSGALVLMAGDRTGAAHSRRRPLVRRFLGRDCAWPAGVFRFAALMDCPVYAIAAIRKGFDAYEVAASRLGDDLAGNYVAFLEKLTLAHPGQWFQFYDFFNDRPNQ